MIPNPRLRGQLLNSATVLAVIVLVWALVQQIVK